MTLLERPRPESYKRLFAVLAPPPAGLHGRFEAELVGPRWFQGFSRFGLGLRGFKGWYGKQFDGQGNGVNLMQRDGQLVEAIPMRIAIEKSSIDGRESLIVRYPPETLWPWPHVIDELRDLDGKTLIGMSHLASSAALPLPFVLHRR